MANSKTNNNDNKWLSDYYTDVSYILPANKDTTWAAQMLYFIKKNSVLFLDKKRASVYRATDMLKLDESVYKQLFDPITPMDEGGEAKYVASDWSANPIYIHLKNIVKADIQRTSKEIECNFTDKFAKTRKMRDNDRLVYQKAFRELINEYAPLAGLKGISDKQDPYKWVQNLSSKKKDTKQKSGQQPQEEQPQQEGSEQKPDAIDSYIDLIKNQISDSKDLAIYNELIYKGDYEIAMELGIKHYMFNQNKWNDRWSDEYIDDIMHFNKACGEWYTDEITGRPVIERFIPEKLYVSPFRRRDGEDIVHYFIEYDIAFSDFIKLCGRDLTPQKLKDVFEWNKMQGTSHGLLWENVQGNERLRDATKIRIGRCACLTQDYEVNMDNYSANYPAYQPVPEKTDSEKPPTKEQKNYNVWRNFYYIPPNESSISNADYEWQSQFIFKLQKNQDQFRYGESGRYVKSPLVIYENSGQASFTDITQSWMPKIHHAYHKFQNCLINDFDTIAISDTFLGGLLAAVDEGNKINLRKEDNMPTGGNGRDAALQQWKMMKQGGTGFLRMVDGKGEVISDPSKYVVPIKNGYLEKAEKWLIMIANMYNQMTQALAFSDVGEGQEAKPRTSVASLQETIKASKNGQWFIQKGYEEFLKNHAERFVQYILMICKEPKDYGYHDRYEEFRQVVGEANGLALEGMENIAAEDVGLTVNYVDNTSKKELVEQIAIERVQNGELDDDFLYLLMGTDNWKYMMALMRLGIKQRKQQKQQEAQQQQQYIMEQKQADLQIAEALNAAKTQGKDQNIVTEGKVNAMIQDQMAKQKQQDQLEIKNKIKDNKIEEETHKKNLNLQAPAGQPA